jgi:hypothetical protein
MKTTISMKMPLRASLFAVLASLPLRTLAGDDDGLAARVTSLEKIVATLRAANAALTAQVNAIKANSVLGLNGKLALNGTTATFTGVNVQVVDGTGGTASLSGFGNLIIGYNEGGSSASAGSHNLVLGTGNSYTSFAGLVAGQSNKISAAYATVTGGVFNTASGGNSSVSGGYFNTASAASSSVTGGESNIASYFGSTVSGGANNTASGNASSVSGGNTNNASGNSSSVSGGNTNTASGLASSISGGFLVTNPADFRWAAGALTSP